MNFDNPKTKANLIVIIGCIVIAILIAACTNSCSASEWNNGVCPKCEIRYELMGVSRGFKYYSCPQCGNEVERY